jgi:hypothetical protein
VAFSPTPELPSDLKSKKSGSSKVKSHQPVNSLGSLGGSEVKIQEGGPLKLMSLSAQKIPIQKSGVEKVPALGLKAAYRDDNLSIGRSEWARPSNDFIRTEKNQSCLDRQISNSSTYSAYSHGSARVQLARKASTDKQDWLKLDTFQSEDLVEEEWIGGHFKAIQRLREGLRADVRSSRFSQRARSRIL